MSVLTPPISSRDHVQGPDRARVTLVEYGDFECPHCGSAYPIIKAIQVKLSRELRFAFRHFPMTKAHAHAQHAAEMSEGAAQHGKFWRMHDLLFEHQDALDDPHLIAYAASLGIDAVWATGALLKGRFERRVREDVASGARSGVNRTPTFFINGQRYDGSTEELLDSLMEATIHAPL